METRLRLKYLITPVVFALLLTPAIKSIWDKGYYPMHDDLQLMRQLQMDKCFQDRQIPCRWVPDMGYGYGYPLFNFYPPLPYYLGQVFRSLGLTYISTVKVVFTLGFIASAIGMYLFTRTFWGRLGGLVSSVFYVYAPYHATELYVRGAINEFWAIAWFPFILLYIYKVITSNTKKDIIPLAFFSALLMLSHNPMLMIFVPFSLVWASYWIISKKAYKSIGKLLISAVWALGLAAFFTLPVVFEQKFVHVETLVIGYFNYLAHFLDLQQLFLKMNWGYGESVYGPNDTMSFNIGHFHSLAWLLVTIAGLVRWRKDRALSQIILLVSTVTLFYTFMTHWKATPIWQQIKPLEFLQFPWRLLSIIILGTSFLSGALIRGKTKSAVILTAVLVAAVVSTNATYFKWRDKWPWVTDEHKFSGELWRLQTTAGIFDYLPKWIPFPPIGPPRGDAQIVRGNGTTHTGTKRSNYQNHKVEIYSDSAEWQLNTFYFPGWKYFIDRQQIPIDPNRNLDKNIGTPIFNLKKGSHIVEAKFSQTRIRKIGDFVSLLSWSFLLSLSVILYINQTKNRKNVSVMT